MSQVMREVDQVKGVMSENINQAMSNLESTEALNEKTQEMKAQSNMFNKQAKAMAAWVDWCAPRTTCRPLRISRPSRSCASELSLLNLSSMSTRWARLRCSLTVRFG